MQYTTLGKTRLTVSVTGLGCGGHSRLGTRSDGTDTALDNAVKVVRRAYDEGINFFDTAEAYRTEEVLGRALAEIPRDRVVVSSKFIYKNRQRGDLRTAGEFWDALHDTLRALRSDYVDLYMIHALHPDDYGPARDRFVPLMEAARRQGKIRHLALSEFFIGDPCHRMLPMALEDGIFDVILVGYNMINASAARFVLPEAKRRRMGTLCMFAVREALSKPAYLREVVKGLMEKGQIDPDAVDEGNPLGFLTEGGAASSVIEAAYRFCRHQRDFDVILTGTGSVDHLMENLHSLSLPPLPDWALHKIADIFGAVDSVSGD